MLLASLAAKINKNIHFMNGNIVITSYVIEKSIIFAFR